MQPGSSSLPPGSPAESARLRSSPQEEGTVPWTTNTRTVLSSFSLASAFDRQLKFARAGFRRGPHRFSRRILIYRSSRLFFCPVRGICRSLMRSNGGRKLGSPGRRTPDSADSAFCVRGQLALEPPCLPHRRYAVLQESSAPRADEHAIWDTLRSRKPGSLRGDAKPVRDLTRDLEGVNRGGP